MQYQIGWQNLDGKRFAVIKMKPVLGDSEVVYKVESPPGDGWQKTTFETATTGMKDWIGNIQEILEVPEKNEIFLTVKGVYEGRMQTLKGIKWREPGKPKQGQRVMITEHVNVAGAFDMLATTKRILDLKNPNLNFVNVGWTNGKIDRFLRIDPYTGEEHTCEGPAAR